MSIYRLTRKTNFYMFYLRGVLACTISPPPKKNAACRLWGRYASYENYCPHPLRRYVISADEIGEEQI